MCSCWVFQPFPTIIDKNHGKKQRLLFFWLVWFGLIWFGLLVWLVWLVGWLVGWLVVASKSTNGHHPKDMD